LKKRILALAAVLALLAVLVAPMAAFAVDVPLDGTNLDAVMTITPPTMPSFGYFVFGWNSIWSSPDGSVTVVNNSDNPTGWTVTAQDIGSYGYMRVGGVGGSVYLGSRLEISPDGGNWYYADAGCTWSGSSFPGALPFYANQYITNGDQAGLYTIIITFTGSLTF